LKGKALGIAQTTISKPFKETYSRGHLNVLIWPAHQTIGRFRDRLEFATIVSFNIVRGIFPEKPQIDHQPSRFVAPPLPVSLPVRVEVWTLLQQVLHALWLNLFTKHQSASFSGGAEQREVPAAAS